MPIKNQMEIAPPGFIVSSPENNIQGHEYDPNTTAQKTGRWKIETCSSWGMAVKP